MRDTPSPKEISLPDAALRLREPYPSTYKRMFAGEISGRRIGARWFVAVADVERLERERASK